MIQDKDYLSVKDVAEMLDTEAYVLRFYEKELNLDIKRNSKGHRVYTLEDVEMFRKIQDMREKGLQLKAIETLVHPSAAGEEAKETYEQLSSISTPQSITPVKNNDVRQVDITDTNDEKVKQFSGMIKEVFMQALEEYNDEANAKIQQMIQQEVELAVDERVTRLQEKQDAKNEEYYKKLDEAMREVQKMRKEMSAVKEEPKKEKSSFWSRLFKDKNQATEL